MADKEAVPAIDDAVVCCMYLDFCLRAGQVVAFDISAKEGADIAHSTNVQFTGSWASTARSRVSVVQSNEPGDAGIASGCVVGFARPIADMSSTVLVNGAECVRHDTVFAMNCSGPDGPANTVGRMVYDRGGGRAAVDEQGQPTQPTDPPLSPEEQAKLADSPGGFWADGYGYDLKNQAGSFWGGFSGAVNGALDTAISAGKVVGQFGAFVVQDLRGQDPSYVFDPSELAAGEHAIGGTAEGIVNLVTSPVETIGAIYDASVRGFADAFERIAAGDAAALAGELAGGGAIGLVSGAGAARIARLGGVVDEARAAGKLDDVIDSGALRKLTPEDIDELQRAGKLTPEEAARAKATHGNDGVVIHKKPLSEIYDERDVTPEHRFDGETHRGDTRSPEDIERAGGFQGTDPNARISAEEHLYKDRPPSQWVSTSQQSDVAAGYAVHGDGSGGSSFFQQAAAGGNPTTYVYHINQPGGVNFNSLSQVAARTGNLEVGFTNIPFSSVTGWTRITVVDGRLTTTYIPNPRARPPGG